MTLKPRLSLLVGLLLANVAFAAAKPVEFDFLAPDNPSVQNPYARELWAEVVTPSGQKLTLPVYYADGGIFAVRARPEEVGTYHFGRVAETTLGIRRTDIVVSLVSPADVAVATRTRLPSILVNPKNHRQLIRSDGFVYEPVGANLAWAPDGIQDRMGFFLHALPEFAHANLNWMRVWMAHWDGMNLDWLPADMGPSPKPGGFSEQVAENWDQLLAAAEDNGVYIQVVLQHHGQYTTTSNSDWAQNPWNAANSGGFLKSPVDFFTDSNARVITVVKYRYIVARWGWSPAVVAWELFNEVHWTDAFAQGHEAEVARWHDEMADVIRSVDVYGHLITTSTENLRSPVYKKMDYYQPHLYAANLIAGARSFDPAPDTLDKPVFYGEEGDDHQPVSRAVKNSGLTLIPPVWASIMGQGSTPAQPWDGWQLYGEHRLGELGAVFRFIALSRIAAQAGLQPFSAKVECAEQAPVAIEAGQFWQRRAAPDMDYPVDGRVPIEAANVPAILSGSPDGIADGFPGRATYHLDFPNATTVRAIVDGVSPKGGALRVSVDGRIVAEQAWAGGIAFKQAAVPVPIAAGRHTILLENPGPDWIAMPEMDLGVSASALALIGRRNNHFIAAWVWHRANLYALNPTPAVAGTLDLEDVAAGSWKVTWWDTVKGAALPSTVVAHPGGVLKIPTPPIYRHAAVVLTRVP